MTQDDRMETITDPAEIRATDEPDERGDFPCCTTPAPASGAGLGVCGYALTDSEGDEYPCDATATGYRWYQDVEHEDLLDVACEFHRNAGGDRMAALVAEVRRLTVEAATQREWFEAADAAADRRLDQSIAWMERAEAAEAEVRRLTGIEAHRDNLAAMIRRLSEFLDGRGLESWKHGACWAAEDAIKTLIARAESAEAEVVTLRDTLARRTDSHTQLVRENETLRARLDAVEANRDEFADLLARALPAVAALARVEALAEKLGNVRRCAAPEGLYELGYADGQADERRIVQQSIRAALATTGEGQ